MKAENQETAKTKNKNENQRIEIYRNNWVERVFRKVTGEASSAASLAQLRELEEKKKKVYGRDLII